MAVVVICDVRGSRKIRNWGEVYSEIKKILESVNHHFVEDFLVPMEFTVGDEFQGVLKTADDTIEIIKILRMKMPVRFYCGIGMGNVEIPDVKGMRGEAFYRARDALNTCKNRKRDTFLISGVDIIDISANAIFFLIQSIEEKWTRRQREIVNFYLENPELTYEKIGKHFGVSKQTITKILKAARFNAIHEGESALKRLLLFVN